MAAGYNVWRDGQQMFGGEVFPKVIDQAIKKRTFRVIALLSIALSRQIKDRIHGRYNAEQNFVKGASAHAERRKDDARWRFVARRHFGGHLASCAKNR
jgi:hypothetical protein